MTSAAATGTPQATDGDRATAGAARHRATYTRLLRLRHLDPNGWQRALFGEGSVVAAALLVLADVATAWTLLVLPVAVAGTVKAHDLLMGRLGRPIRPARLIGPPGSPPKSAP